MKTELHQKVEEVTNLERRYLIWILNVINLILSQWINVLWIWVIFLIFVFFLSFYNLKCCIFLIVLFRVKDMENYGDKVQEELQDREKELSSLERKWVHSKVFFFRAWCYQLLYKTIFQLILQSFKFLYIPYYIFKWFYFFFRVEQKATENKTLKQNVLLQSDKVTALEERFVFRYFFHQLHWNTLRYHFEIFHP